MGINERSPFCARCHFSLNMQANVVSAYSVTISGIRMWGIPKSGNTLCRRRGTLPEINCNTPKSAPKVSAFIGLACPMYQLKNPAITIVTGAIIHMELVNNRIATKRTKHPQKQTMVLRLATSAMENWLRSRKIHKNKVITALATIPNISISVTPPRSDESYEENPDICGG